jgi:hypothetical protein
LILHKKFSISYYGQKKFAAAATLAGQFPGGATIKIQESGGRAVFISNVLLNSLLCGGLSGKTAKFISAVPLSKSINGA